MVITGGIAAWDLKDTKEVVLKRWSVEQRLFTFAEVPGLQRFGVQLQKTTWNVFTEKVMSSSVSFTYNCVKLNLEWSSLNDQNPETN